MSWMSARGVSSALAACSIGSCSCVLPWCTYLLHSTQVHIAENIQDPVPHHSKEQRGGSSLRAPAQSRRGDVNGDAPLSCCADVLVRG